MKIVFFGTPEWAVPSLRELAGSGYAPALVVTQPVKRRGRGGGTSPSPVAAASADLGLECISPAGPKETGLLSRIASESPDLLVVVAYGRILPAQLLEEARLGGVNLHFSLLPRYRGAAPVQWAIADGAGETGVTTMRMVAALDAGPIYLQRPVPIEPGEHAPALGRRLSRVGAQLLLRTVESLDRGGLPEREQDEQDATYARRLNAEDGWIDWRRPAESIARRVRGFDPWPGQSAMSRKGKIQVLEARAAEATGVDCAPGTVLGEAGKAVRIACGDGSGLDVHRLQREGRGPVSGADALRGRHLSEGERLGGRDAPKA